MKFLKKMKDGGPDSTVTGYWLMEIKSLLSVVLLKFEGDSRDAFHNHAFNCISWVLNGFLIENILDNEDLIIHGPSIIPFITRRSTFHKVDSVRTSWVLSIRGPWSKTWKEYIPSEERIITLSEGRKEV